MDKFELAKMALTSMMLDIYQDQNYLDVSEDVHKEIKKMVSRLGDKYNGKG